MRDANRSVFRTDAIQRYMEAREKAVLPRFVSPHILLCLWSLLGLLVASGFVAWFAQVPVYASGPAIIVDWKDTTKYTGDEVLAVAFVPPEKLAYLRLGQPIFLKLGTSGEHSKGMIIAVEPGIRSPNAAQNEFALGAGAALAITQPVAVAIARVKLPVTSLPPSTYIGSVYPADIEVGSRRVISLLLPVSHIGE